MRWIMLFTTVLVVCFINVNSKTINEFDNKIFELYTINFQDYLYVDEEYALCVDNKKFNDDFKKYGKIDFCNDTFRFIIKFNFINEREYYFYLEKNNEK